MAALTSRRRKRLEEFIAPFRVEPGSKVKLLKDFDPGFKAGIKNKKAGVALLEEGVTLLSEYQERLAAQDTWGVLVVLQALDAAGKDGTIRHVMSGVNPQGQPVTAARSGPRSSHRPASGTEWSRAIRCARSRARCPI